MPSRSSLLFRYVEMATRVFPPVPQRHCLATCMKHEGYGLEIQQPESHPLQALSHICGTAGPVDFASNSKVPERLATQRINRALGNVPKAPTDTTHLRQRPANMTIHQITHPSFTEYVASSLTKPTAYFGVDQVLPMPLHFVPQTASPRTAVTGNPSLPRRK